MGQKECAYCYKALFRHCCFLGTGAFVFSFLLQKKYLKNRAHIFVKLNFVFKKSDAQKLKISPPRIRFFKKMPENQKNNFFGFNWQS